MFHLKKKCLNPDQKTILCIPDIKASWHFISKAYELHLNLILILEESWLESVDCSDTLELVVVSDLTSTKEIITQVDKIIERLEYSVSIDYVVAFTEQHIELIGLLTDYYGAHGISSTQAQLFRDKYVMKQRAKEIGIACPKFSLWNTVDDRECFYEELLFSCKRKNKSMSIIVKPRKGWASNGVRRFSEIKDLEAYMYSYINDPDNWLLEEYILGDIFHVNTVLKDGRAIFCVVGKYGIQPLQVSKSYKNHFIDYIIEPKSEIANKLFDAHQTIIEGFGLSVGMTHFEFFVEENTGEILLCEAAARPPGMDIPRLQEIAVEHNPFSIFAEGLANNNLKERLIPKFFAGMICFTSIDGILMEVDSLDKFSDIEIVYKEQKTQIGKIFQPSMFFHELGRLYIKAESEEKCIHLLEQYAQTFRYRVEPCDMNPDFSQRGY